MKRIDFLDSLRGIAILIVVLHHAFSRWAELVPYGCKYCEFPLFRCGFLGVQLFFLISGFVILMSLNKTKSLANFIYKRWLRLFPAMLIATILIYASARYFPERPWGIPQLNSVIPGLLFIEPLWIKLFTGLYIRLLEGVFWTLFVEVKFYIIFGILYFYLGEIKAIKVLFFLYLVSLLPNFYNSPYPYLKYITSGVQLLSFEYFGWFTSGSLAYLFFVSKKKQYLIFSIAVALLQLWHYKHDIQVVLFSLMIITCFFAPIIFEKARVVYNNRFFVFIGFISYPLYLIHGNAMIAMIVKLNNQYKNIPSILLPLIPIIFLCLIAFIIVKTEPALRKVLSKK